MTERLQFKDLLMDESLLNNCRMCFKVKKNSIKIFDGWNNYGSKIYAVTGIEIIESSQIPALICIDCLITLNLAYNLRTQCRKTNEKFRKILWESFERKKWTKNLKSLREEEVTDIKCEYDEEEELIEEIQEFKFDYSTYEIYEEVSDELEPEIEITTDTLPIINTKKPSNPQRPKPIRHNKRKAHESRKEKCKLCAEIFPTLLSLKRHMKAIHCDKFFELIQPKEIEHENLEYICDYCGKAFPNRPKFDMHIRRHPVQLKDDEKPFGPCTTCGNFFRSKYNLNYHEKSHQRKEEDFWYCDLCGHRFLTRYKIFTHIRTRHVEKIRFYCKDCPGKSFGTKYVLQRHINFKHLNIRNHVCEYCSKSFYTPENLKNHLRIHTGERPFCCKFCDKKFAYKIDCMRHEWTHEGRKKFTCITCRRCYDSKELLDGHKCFWK